MDFANLKALLDRNVGRYYPCLDICIHHRGEEILRYQTGYSNTETKSPVNPDALYYIFSCTKPGTCTAALQLLEKGYYRLSDPVYEYIPEFKDVMVKVVKDNGDVEYEASKSPITIRQIFSMTSGINYNFKTPYINDVREKTGGRMPTLEVVKAIAKNPLEFHPGEHYYYGLNHDVLGGLIEVWSGMKFGEYMKKNVYDLCGMNNTGFKVTDDVKSKMPPLCRCDENGNYSFEESSCDYALGENSEYESGGAGAISCVDDYIQLADALANGGVSPKTGERILTQHTIDLMSTNVLEKEQAADFWLYNDGYGYGLGVRTLVTNGKGILSNVGEFGWDGAAGCFFLADPKEQLSVFYARNIFPGRNNETFEPIINTLYSELYK